MKYLVITSNDERYDFNLEIKTYEDVSISEICHNEIIDQNELKLVNGIYKYSVSKRTKDFPSGCNLSDEEWDIIKEKIDNVSFNFMLIIPFEKLEQSAFYLMDGIVCRNSKFGFLDGANK